MTNWIRQVLECGTKGTRNLLVSNLKTCMENPRDQWEEQLATVLTGYGLTEQAQQFLPRRKYREDGNWEWRMWKEGRPILVWGYYILGTTRQYLSMVGLWEPRTPTDHQMFLGVIIGEGVTRRRAYIKWRTTWPIQE